MSTIVDEAWCQKRDHKDAYDPTTSALKKSNGKLNAIVAANDETATGAIQALTEHKLAGTVPVSGQDADLAGVVRIIQGTRSMTVYKPLGPLAKRAVDAAITLAHGGRPESFETVPSGSHIVPTIVLQPIAVDQRNLGATVLSDGFHSADEIKKALGPGEWENFCARRRALCAVLLFDCSTHACRSSPRVTRSTESCNFAAKVARHWRSEL